MAKALFAVMVAALTAACGGEPAAPSAPATIEERGRKEFRACAICHTVSNPAAPGAARLVGPSLYRIYGAPSARQPDFTYSQALRAANLVWDEATLDAYIESPAGLIPGTRMAFAGEGDAEKRAAIIAYLKTAQ
jgi:cytochrome c